MSKDFQGKFGIDGANAGPNPNGQKILRRLDAQTLKNQEGGEKKLKNVQEFRKV